MAKGLTTGVSSKNQNAEINRGNLTVTIGKPKNPTGRILTLKALQAGDIDIVCRDAENPV